MKGTYNLDKFNQLEIIMIKITFLIAKLMAMHKTIMAELEDAIEKSKNINDDGDKS